MKHPNSTAIKVIFITIVYATSPSLSDLKELKKYVEESNLEIKSSLRKIRADLDRLGQISDRLDRMVTVLKSR